MKDLGKYDVKLCGKNVRGCNIGKNVRSCVRLGKNVGIYDVKRCRKLRCENMWKTWENMYVKKCGVIFNVKIWWEKERGYNNWYVRICKNM